MESAHDPSDKDAEQANPALTRVITGRPANACVRCRSRKVKCTCERPSCTSCLKAKVTCTYPDRSMAAPTLQYVERLEAQIKQLEANSEPVPKRRRTGQLHTSAAEMASMSPMSNSSHQEPSPHRLPANSHTQHRSAPPSASQLFDRLPSAVDLDQVILEASEEEVSGSGSGGEAELVIGDLPAKGEMDKAIHFFFTHINTAFPIFHESTLSASVLRAYEGNPSPVDAFTVFAMMAVWCTSQSRGKGSTSDHLGRASLNWSKAQLFIQAALARSGIVKLQMMHLVLQYVLRHPEAGDIWELTGTAVRTTFDLGLHLEAEGTSKHSYTTLQLDMRRRLFWATYCLDHKVAVALGRPPGIVSDWVSTRFPSLCEDSAISQTPSVDGPISHRKESVIQHIRLRILQAEIYQRLFTVAASKSPPPSAGWLLTMSLRLDDWRNGYNSGPDELLTPDWLELHFNLSCLLLFRPNPGNPNPDQNSLQRALMASSFLMRTYKAMWRRKAINFVWLAIHHVFISGVTYLNCIWEAAKHDWPIVPSLVDAILDIQCCSQVLEGMTDSQPGTARMRDAFEVVSAAVIRRLSTSTKANPTEPPISAYPGASTTVNMSASVLPASSDELLGMINNDTVQMQPWMTWAADPSRPPSPTPNGGGNANTDDSLANFFFHPLAMVPSVDDFGFDIGGINPLDIHRNQTDIGDLW